MLEVGAFRQRQLLETTGKASLNAAHEVNGVYVRVNAVNGKVNTVNGRVKAARSD